MKYERPILRMVSMVLILMTTEVVADGVHLGAEQWEASRNGDALAKLPPLREVVDRWSTTGDQNIELHYPGGEEGELWVGELRDWLVALGVPSSRTVIVPGSGAADVIIMHVVRTGG